MTVRIGVIGAGVMGLDHARTIARSVAGARVVAVADADPPRARRAAEESGASHCLTDGFTLILHPEVDAVLVASPDETHAPYTRAAIEAGKPVLCEKPLAPDAASCRAVAQAERQRGRRFVQIGFMRRFDPFYRDLKTALSADALGDPLLVHAAHRNASAPSFWQAGMAVSNAAVHEFDIMRWLLDDEITSIAVQVPQAASQQAVPDPLLILLRTARGTLIDVEIFMNAGYGYDIRTEAVCRGGTAVLARPTPPTLHRTGSAGAAYPSDWRGRFADAYRLQAQAWVDAIGSGQPVGADAWDGLAATLVAEAGLKALATGAAMPVEIGVRP